MEHGPHLHELLAHHRKLITALSVAVFVLSILLLLLLTYAHSINYNRVSEDLQPRSTTTGLIRTEPSPFLEEQEVVVLPDKTATSGQAIIPVERVLFDYVEVTDGCGTHFEGECLNVRSGPGTEFPVVAQLRNGIVLKISGIVERDDEDWYKVVFDETLRYPERVTSDWYVSAAHVEVLLDEGDKTIWDHEVATTTKRIVIDRSEQKLYAYEDGELFMEIFVSTGHELTPTPRGTFSVFKKTPSRYMQGPIPGIAEQYYDMPGVPWNLYFTHGGAVIHGAYWHNSFGSRYSHGCVNLPPEEARALYHWTPLGAEVTVQD